MSQHLLYLIDGSSYIFRAYYGVRADLSTSDGFPTKAVYGFATMLLKFLREYEPRYLGMVFDSKGKVFRNEIYPEYKANRDEAPENLKLQFPKIFELVRAFSIPMLAMEGYEADDIMGTIARAQGTSKVVLVTGDKDFCQLVSEKVTLVDTMKERVTGVQEVRQKYGIEPGQMIDFFALVGDAVDNIPGVARVGEKTASALISKYGNLDGVYGNLEEIEEIRPSIARSLREHKDDAYLSRELVTIKTDVEVGTGIEDFRYDGYATEDLQEIFSELEFEKLLDEIGASRTRDESEAVRYDSYETVFEEKALGRVVSMVEEAGELSIDLETDSKLPMNAGIVGFSLCPAPGRAFYVPVGHVGTIEAEKQMGLQAVLSMLKPILESEDINKTGQNIKYEMLVLRNHGVTLRGIYFDTMLAAHLLDASRGSYKLDELSRTELGHRMISYDDVTGKGKSKKNFSEVDIETATRYSCEDSDVTLILSRKFLETLKQEGLWDLYRENVLGLLPVLCDMEFTGVSVDIAILEEMSKEFEKDLSSIEAEIYEKTGGKFNINSTKQLSEVLFEKLRLPARKKTAKGAFSTDSEVLRDLSTIHEVPRLILRHRFLSKLKSTYIDQLPRLINPATGRIHTSFNPAGTSTGRLSSRDPNLQNIPIKTEDGKKIRKSFVAKDGCLILSADYSQIELRLLAHFSGDPTLLEALRGNKDVHIATACEIFNATEDQVTSEMRNLAKTINFGIIYGISAFGLSKQLGTTVSVSRNYINRYFDRYSEVKAYMQSSVEEARSRGYTETLVGRRRPIPELVSRNRVERNRGEREAINTPIQGSAADIINLAMIRIFTRLEEEGFRSKMILQVHDELLFEVHETELEELQTHIKNDMENAWELSVPLRVEMRAAENWAEAH
ncbi:MAG: DNA polymerase I [Candidatus Dadabacteria bacterium]|nr:DNA polymerase I [Candidatus Dadabacteria bacterium]